MRIFALSEIDPERISLLSNNNPNLVSLGYRVNRKIVPLMIRFPVLYGNGDYTQKKPFHSILVTCIGSDNEDQLTDLMTRIETRIFQLIRQHQDRFSQLKRYKSSLKSVTNDDQVYRFGVFRFRFTEAPVFDPMHKLIDDLYLPHLLGLPGYVEALVHLSCIWIKGETFGLYWRVLQLELQNGPLPGTDLEIPGYSETHEESPFQYEGETETDNKMNLDEESLPNSFSPTDSEN